MTEATATTEAGGAPADASPSRVVVERDVDVPMRDGVVLRADVYRPDGDGVNPVLLGRTCYGKSTWGQWIDPLRTASEGYAVVINDMRGGFGSDGEFHPFFHDIDDGYDVVEWCAEQSWSNGKVGMFGSSAPGFMQLLAAISRPPHLCAIAPMQTWSSFGRGCVYDCGGAFLLYTQQWALMVSNLDPRRRLAVNTEGYEERRENAARAAWDVGWGYRHLPVPDFPALPREQSAFYHRWLEHPDHDPFWHSLDLAPRYADIEVPALHLVGWFDKFRIGSTANYAGIRRQGGSVFARENQRLVIGPWTHGIPVRAEGSDEYFGVTSGVDVRGLVLRWYDHWLKGVDNGLLEEAPVRIFVQGENRWRGEREWPLERTRYTELYLHSDGRAGEPEGGLLSEERPAEEASDTYSYDPQDPTPTSPRGMGRREGPLDLREVEARDDVLVYSSVALSEDLEVTGTIVARLWAATSAADTDWVVTLADVFPDGRARRVTEGMLRARYRVSQEQPQAVPVDQPVQYEIELAPTSNLFRAGHRIRIDVASASFPQYDLNLGRGVPFDGDVVGAEATQSVFHDAMRPSQIVLPVIPRS